MAIALNKPALEEGLTQIIEGKESAFIRGDPSQIYTKIDGLEVVRHGHGIKLYFQSRLLGVISDVNIAHRTYTDSLQIHFNPPILVPTDLTQPF